MLTLGGGGGLACSRTETLSIYNWGDYLAPTILEGFAASESKRATTRVLQDFFLSEGEMDAKLANQIVKSLLAG